VQIQQVFRNSKAVEVDVSAGAICVRSWKNCGASDHNSRFEAFSKSEVYGITIASTFL
jgi:hypothetical protein